MKMSFLLEDKFIKRIVRDLETTNSRKQLRMIEKIENKFPGAESLSTPPKSTIETVHASKSIMKRTFSSFEDFVKSQKKKRRRVKKKLNNGCEKQKFNGPEMPQIDCLKFINSSNSIVNLSIKNNDFEDADLKKLKREHTEAKINLTDPLNSWRSTENVSKFELFSAGENSLLEHQKCTSPPFSIGAQSYFSTENKREETPRSFENIFNLSVNEISDLISNSSKSQDTPCSKTCAESEDKMKIQETEKKIEINRQSSEQIRFLEDPSFWSFFSSEKHSRVENVPCSKESNIASEKQQSNSCLSNIELYFSPRNTYMKPNSHTKPDHIVNQQKVAQNFQCLGKNANASEEQSNIRCFSRDDILYPAEDTFIKPDVKWKSDHKTNQQKIGQKVAVNVQYCKQKVLENSVSNDVGNFPYFNTENSIENPRNSPCYSKNNPITSRTNSLSKSNFDVLEEVSSPLLNDPDCRYVLESLMNPPQSQNKTTSIEQLVITHGTRTCIEDSYRISETPRIEPVETLNETKTPSEIFKFISTQNYSEASTQLSCVFENIETLKTSDASDDIYYRNSKKLLKQAFQMYLDLRNSISCTLHSKFESKNMIVVVEKEVEFKTFALVEKVHEYNIEETNEDCDIIESEMNPNTNNKLLEVINEICSDKDLIFEEGKDGYHHSTENQNEISKRISMIFEEAIQDFIALKSPALRIPKTSFRNCCMENGILVPVSSPKRIILKYKNRQTHKRYCLVMFILAKILELLMSNTKLTKREIYYQIKDSVLSQTSIDEAVKTVSTILSVGPWSFNIVAQKGLVFGNLKITISSEEVINCNVPGTAVPLNIDEITELKSNACFILVVEKESVFHKLLEEDLPQRLAKPFIMITGKGFPDFNTQLFLRKLWMMMSIPVFIFTDADPHGIHIMMTYRFGSMNNAHISHHLAIPKARWLGVFPSEISKLDAKKQILSPNEIKCAENLLKSPYMNGNPEIEKELRTLLENRYKTGIEGIMKNGTFLSQSYFPLKFFNKNFK